MTQTTARITVARQTKRPWTARTDPTLPCRVLILLAGETVRRNRSSRSQPHVLSRRGASPPLRERGQARAENQKRERESKETARQAHRHCTNHATGDIPVVSHWSQSRHLCCPYSPALGAHLRPSMHAVMLHTAKIDSKAGRRKAENNLKGSWWQRETIPREIL